MKHKQSDMKQEEIRWRRDKILELSSRGNSEREIAATLQISPATAHRDIVYLNQLAKENISKYIDEKLPAEYQKCLVGITAIMKESWSTAASAESEGGANSRRDKLQALSLAKESYAMKWDLLSSATIVDRAITFVENHRIQPRGLTDQNKKVTIEDGATESIQSIR